MLDLKLLRENLDEVKARMATRGAPIDWDEFWNVVNGHGQGNVDRLAARVKAWDDGAWVREAALEHERKRAARERDAA